MNNNKTDESALLSRGKGVFSKASYITIGTRENPEMFGKKCDVRSNFKGKQFTVLSTKTGRMPSSFFAKKHDWISDGARYADRTFYADSQKDRPKGFLTSDFSRRDEFANTIRTEQYREQMKQEQKFADRFMIDVEIPIENIDIKTEAKSESNDFLYDHVFEKKDLPSSGASKTPRDTCNPTLLSKERNLGSLRTTYHLNYPPPIHFDKPKFARKAIIRDTFYRKMNIPLQHDG